MQIASCGTMTSTRWRKGLLIPHVFDVFSLVRRRMEKSMVHGSKNSDIIADYMANHKNTVEDSKT